MPDPIARSAEAWCLIRRVEAVWCQLPNLDAVMDGYHVVRAEGVDGVRAEIYVDTESVRAVVDDLVLLTQLMWLGKQVLHTRHTETTATL